MSALNYRGKPPEQQRGLTRTEFTIVLAGAAVLAAILAGAAYFYFAKLQFPF